MLEWAFKHIYDTCFKWLCNISNRPTDLALLSIYLLSEIVFLFDLIAYLRLSTFRNFECPRSKIDDVVRIMCLFINVGWRVLVHIFRYFLRTWNKISLYTVIGNVMTRARVCVVGTCEMSVLRIYRKKKKNCLRFNNTYMYYIPSCRSHVTRFSERVCKVSSILWTYEIILKIPKTVFGSGLKCINRSAE